MNNNIINVLSAPVVRASLILKHGTANEWADINPILLEGELGIETDTHFIKVGDGKSRYSELPYLNATSVELLFDGIYNSTTNKVALQSSINEAINSLNGILENSPNNNKTLTNFNQSNGIITATFDNIEITLSQISDVGTAAKYNAVNIINEENNNLHDMPNVMAVVDYVNNKIPTLNNAIKYTFSEGSINGNFNVTATDNSIQSVKIHGLNNAAYEDVAINGVTQNDNGLVNANQVYNYIEDTLANLILNCGTSTTVI